MRMKWTRVGKRGLSAWALQRSTFAYCWQHWGRHKECKMSLQVTTASLALLFAVALILSSNRFVDNRAANVNLPVAVRAMQ